MGVRVLRKWFALGFCPRRRRAFAFVYVAGPPAFVFFVSQHFEVDDPAFRRPPKDLFEKRHTPTASGPRAAAFGHLAGDARLMDANKALQLAAGHMEAKTDVIVEVHCGSPNGASENSQGRQPLDLVVTTL